MLKDKDIREPLFDFLEERFGKNRILEEKNMGVSSRADVVMVLPSQLIGIEIKSDVDSYVRLDSQVSDYDRCFDGNIIVVGSSHALHVEEHVPDYWGIISVEEDAEEALDFYVVREMKENPKLNPKEKLRFLWRPELAHIQEKYGLYKYAGKSKDFVQDYLLESVSPEDLAREISEELFERDYTKIHEQINAYRKAHGQKPRIRRKRRKRRRTVTH